jgi:2-polyprenyl-6-methoxyphenol hydroxylase-like FAD-dependent oxidoreductase
MQQVVETRHRIAIIGGGIAGLSLALALSNLNKTQLKQWDIVVFESKPHYSDHDHYLCIWKFGIKALLELGIGKRLGSIAFPISSLCSVDCLANQTVVDWTHAPDENLNSDNLPPMYLIINQGRTPKGGFDQNSPHWVDPACRLDS